MTERGGAQPGSAAGAAPARAGLWGGRFEAGSGPHPALRALGDSLRFDWRLVREDIEGSVAWARALAGAGVLSEAERGRIAGALAEIDALAAAHPKAPPSNVDAEDVHSWVEAALIERVGALGKKLHTGRSRNDQVATDTRLWLRRQILARLAELHAVCESLVSLAEREGGPAESPAPFPGYTHLQRAQPVLFAHWCLAYFEMFDRDSRRLRDALRRVNVCPLGAGALAGAAFAIDRAALARALGFAAPTANSLDAVSDRDAVIETLAGLALCAAHCSRLGEDLVLYSSAEFALLRMSDDVATGSSLMPQKKNPDAAELVRGKCGRMIGALVALLTTLKGTPLAYNRDFQEDKEPLFDAMDTITLCLRVLPPLLDGLRLDRERALAAARGGHANATELADYLVERGVPFRDAHDAAGRAVRLALSRGAALEDLSIEDFRAVADAIGPDVYPRLSLDSTLGRRDVFGATAPARVARARRHARRRLQAGKPQPADARVTLRRATLGDAPDIARLVNDGAGWGANLPRTEADIAAHTREFTVAVSEAGHGVVGCGALALGENGVAEVRSLSVRKDHAGRGVGTALTRRLCADALRLGVERAFVLTCSPEFFERVGFATANHSALGPTGLAAWARRDRSGKPWRAMVWESEFA